MTTPVNPPSAAKGMWLIVKRELGQYTTTWSGYVIAALTLLATGLFYNVDAVGSSPQYSTDVLSRTFYIISGFTIIASLLFSMRLIAEERQSGSLPLLATSHLSDGQIIFAKFASALMLLVIFLALTMHLPLLVFINGKVAMSHILAGYFGLLLIGATAISIGIFGSALTSSQLVAIVISGVITVVMLLLWLTSRVVDGWLGDVISYMALHDKHFRPFMDGTISTANVIFYLTVTGFFLVLARNVLEARRWRA